MQATPQFSNPFYANDAVRDLTMFFGRQRELHMLYQAITKHQSVSVVGIRHIGKSSILKFLGDPALQQIYGFDARRFIFILTDWREYLQQTREDFFQAVCDQIMAQCQFLSAARVSPLSGANKFRKLLEEIKLGGFHPVLIMDAFDRVTSNPEFDPHFFSFLRSLAGVNDLISYITATRKPLYKVCHSDAVAQSPFFNIFLACSIGALTPEEARSLVISPAQQTPFVFSTSEVDWLLKQAGMHPFFLQVTCRHLFEEKRLQADGNVLIENVQRSIEQELRPHFEKTWDDLEEEEQKQLTIEVFQHAHRRPLRPELSSSMLFCRKVRKMSQHEPVEVLSEDIKGALDHLDDIDFLTKSKLSNLRCVSLQIDDAGAATASKHGLLVRELLKKAFEHMKPVGLRNDTDQEWKLYNILWYHYFKYRLPNHHTAARLSLSLRQFYREQDKAIEALRKEVLAIEEAALGMGE